MLFTITYEITMPADFGVNAIILKNNENKQGS